MDDERMPGSEKRHRLGDEGNRVGGVNTHDLRRGSRGISERAKKVEDGADA
jgi:hypothetical protein